MAARMFSSAAQHDKAVKEKLPTFPEVHSKGRAPTAGGPIHSHEGRQI